MTPSRAPSSLLLQWARASRALLRPSRAPPGFRFPAAPLHCTRMARGTPAPPAGHTPILHSVAQCTPQGERHAGATLHAGSGVYYPGVAPPGRPPGVPPGAAYPGAPGAVDPSGPAYPGVTGAVYPDGAVYWGVQHTQTAAQPMGAQVCQVQRTLDGAVYGSAGALGRGQLLPCRLYRGVRRRGGREWGNV